MLVILNVVAVAILDITQSFVQFSARCSLVFKSGISEDLKLDTYFKGTTICAFKNSLCALAISGSTFAATSLVVNAFNKLDLYLKELELSAITLSVLPAAFKGYSCLLNRNKLAALPE